MEPGDAAHLNQFIRPIGLLKVDSNMARRRNAGTAETAIVLYLLKKSDIKIKNIIITTVLLF